MVILHRTGYLALARMKKFFNTLLFFSTTLLFAQNEREPKIHNYTSFGPVKVAEITPELIQNTPQNYQSHPEFGKPAFNVQCDSCLELIQKRTLAGRYFIKKNTGGNTFYVQQSAADMHMPDANGNLITIDPRLQPHPLFPNISHAPDQPNPTQFDINTGATTIQIPAFDLTFNAHVDLYQVVSNQELSGYGPMNLTSTTVGEDGAYTTNAWSGIDRELSYDRGAIKTNFILNSVPANLNALGWLVFEDVVTLPAGYTVVRSTDGSQTAEGYWQGDLKVMNISGNSQVASWAQPLVFDNSGGFPDAANIAYDVVVSPGNIYHIRTMVRSAWLLDATRMYPITVDPLVSGTNTWTAGTIGFTDYTFGSGFCGGSATWCTGGPLNITFPGQATVTNVLWDLDYFVVAGNAASNGGFKVVGPCGIDPVNPDAYYACPNVPGNPNVLCGGPVRSAPWLATCLAPQCPPSVIPFTIRNIRCVVGVVVCSIARYFTVNNTWVMTVEGQTVAQPAAPTSSLGTTICAGVMTTLTANGQWGVPPYTYVWAPGGQTTQSINVSPIVNSTYTCTITDICGLTSSNSVTITITSNNLTPAPVVNYVMSPVSGNPCPVTITYCTDVGSAYNGGPDNFIWGFTGGTVLSGGATSGSANGPTYGGAGSSASCGGGQFYSVQYTVPGAYWATFSVTSGASCTSVNIPIVICGFLPIELLVFEADYLNGSVMLHWITESEDGNDFFTIERSTDGIHFEDVLIVDGAGTSSTRNEYYAADESPPTGIVYYRLKQTDFDGNITYSALESVTVSEFNLSGLMLSPNPANDNCEVYFEANGTLPANAIVKIFDLAGREVYSKGLNPVKGVNKVSIDLRPLNQGMYLLRLSTEPGSDSCEQKILIRQ